MEDNYIKEKNINSQENNEIDLIVNIIKTRNQLEVANINFEFATGDLIDYYIYKIKAERAKLDYLLKKAKSKGLAIDMIDQIDIKYNKVI